MVEFSNGFDTQFKSKFGFSYSEDVDALRELKITPIDRWKFVSEVLDLLPDASASLFIHVPKTGGTTFGESVAERGLRNVVSCDASEMQFLSMLRACFVDPNERGILFRAHHNYQTIFRDNKVSRFDFIFSSFRDPLAVHTSNVTMILERLDKFYRGVDQGPDVSHFCEAWDRAITESGLQFELSNEFAIAVLASQHYVKTMSGVYNRFFGLCTDEQLRNVTFFNYKSFDSVMVERFGFETPPERKNVASDRGFKLQNVPAEVCAALLESDAKIVSRIQTLFPEVVQLPAHEVGLFRWIRSAFLSGRLGKP